MSTAQAVKKTTPRRLPALALIAALALAPVVVSGDQALAAGPACGPLVDEKHQVSTAAQLQAVGSGGAGTGGCGLGASYVQTAVIELDGVAFTPIGGGAEFRGSYDGRNLAIRDLEIDVADQKVGLFGVLGLAGTLQNIRLERAQVVATGNSADVGALVGLAEGSDGEIVKILSSHASGSVTGGTVDNQAISGGLVGALTRGLIEDSSADVVVECKKSDFAPCGGFVGIVGFEANIKNSTARGNVSALGGPAGGFVGLHRTAGSTTTGSTAEGNVTGVGTVGGFVGELEEGTITNSQALGRTVVGTGSQIGGFVGELDRGSIVGSSAKIDVEGNGKVGGFAGEQSNTSSISRSFATGTVTGLTGSVGGLVGEQMGTASQIIQSYASGPVTGGGDEVGGLVGSHRGPIDDSYATGSVTITIQGDAGGLVGYSNGGDLITNSYSTGLVIGEDGEKLGGLVGGTTARTVTESFWDIETSGRENSAGGEGKTTAEMTSFATYSGAGWKIIQANSFGVPTGPENEIWGIGSAVNCGYPFLWWQTENAHQCAPSSSGSSNSPNAGSTSKEPDASATPGIHLDVQASVGSPVAGASVVIGGQGLQPGSAYSLVVRSTPITVVSGVASGTGSFSKRVTLPAGIAPGNHTITLRATGSDGSALVLTQSFTVAANGTFSALGAVTGSTTAGLAVTGVNGPLALGVMSLATLLMLAGAGLMVARRRAEALSS
jgi:hypothetical protein